MAWWRPKEEPSPQTRVGRTTRPLDPAPPVVHRPREPGQAVRPAEPGPPHVAAPPRVAREVSPHISAGGQRSFPMGRVMVLVIVVAVIVPGFLGISSFFSSIDDLDVDGVSTPKGHDGPSLVRRDRFAEALERIGDRVGPEGTVFVLRVAPDRIDAVAREAGGEGRVVQVRADLSTISTPAGSDGPRGISIRRVDPAAPERIARAGARLVDARPGDLNYMALAVTPTDGKGTWSAFFDVGGTSTLVIAKLDGRGAYVPGRTAP